MAPAPPLYPSQLSEGHTTLKSLPKLTPRRKRTQPENPLPVPETPPLPKPSGGLTPSIEPSRRILSPHDHDLFLKSPTHILLLSFIFSLSESCTDKKLSTVRLDTQIATQYPIVPNLLSVLSSISALVDATPPEDQGSSRFGNPAFRKFFDALSTTLPDYAATISIPPSYTPEASTYLLHSFGSATRIDYGSGHELNFILYLLCLYQLNLLPPPTFSALALSVFPNYIHLCRKIQSTYYLEPAGSHGVWGLDDYHFLPFLFGASQLLHHPYIRPLGVHNELLLEEEGDEYIYLDMVRYTISTKTVKGLKWTQPMLDDISGAKNWEKVEQGMRRMFVKEVLGKLPVMQHFLFGSLIPAAEGMGVEEDNDKVGEGNLHSDGQTGDHIDSAGHVHRDDAGGDCCGIKIPSAIAAAQEAKKRGGGDLRRVPFD
jgi:serine/threonine-protein phosphatase 2A activator